MTGRREAGSSAPGNGGDGGVGKDKCHSSTSSANFRGPRRSGGGFLGAAAPVEGPYRDIGAGFARLTGAEAPRRAPSSIASVEGALLELLRNSRDAGAENVFVASTLRSRRYRSITVIDDGRGVPESHADLIFEPGVTTRHLSPVLDPPRSGPGASAHGAGLALHHIRSAAVEAKLLRASSPTSIRAIFDTRAIPERALQSGSRRSGSNLPATASAFAKENPTLALFHASPAAIFAALLKNHIIQTTGEGGRSGLASRAKGIGLDVSAKTAGRVLRGEVGAAGRVVHRERGPGRGGRSDGSGSASGTSAGFAGPAFSIGGEERREVEAVLRRAASASYLEVGEVKFEARPGGVVITASVHEPEDEYG